MKAFEDDEVYNYPDIIETARLIYFDFIFYFY